jgi:hypothetical protein
MNRIVFVLGVFVLAFTVGVATATASGGNSAAAKLCQKNGWQTLVHSDGTPFANQDDCVSYSAQGGTLTPALFANAAHDCTTLFGGTFVPNPTTGLWACIGWNNPDTVQFGPSVVLLTLDCGADGGTLTQTTGPRPGVDSTTCS